MNGEIIKSFLVGLGFGVDETSLAQFNKSIASAALRVTALYASIKVAAAGIFLGISKISEGFEQLGYEYRIIAPAINKAIQLRQALLSAYQAAGINMKKAVQQSVVFNYSLAKTKFALEAVYKSVGLKFLPVLTKQMDLFRKQIYANMPRIQNSLEKFVKFILKAFEATTILGGRIWSILGRVYEFFQKLDKATDGWSTVILSVIAAWKLLNLAFLATPLGMLLTGLVALLALWDDFRTWKEGGQSLFDWSKFVPIIQTVTQVLSGLWEILKGIGSTIYGIAEAFTKLLNSDFSDFKSFFGEIQRAAESLSGVFQGLWGTIKGIGGSLASFSGLTGSLGSMFGSPNTKANLENNPTVNPLATPIGSNVSNSKTTQHVSQETSIVVQGSPNASSTGSAVAAEQSRVNFDLARNLKGATR